VKRARLVALATVVALLVGGAVPTAATAASSVATAVGPGEAEVTAKVQYRATPSSTPMKLSPNTQVTVSFWKLDPAAGYWYEQAEGTWTEGGPDQVDTSHPLSPGTYSIRFLVDKDPSIDGESIGGEWWNDARYFYESDDVVLTGGQTFDLGTVILEPRTFDVDRLSGADRYETAVQASQATIPTGTNPAVVYLANGANYPDALAAGPAAIAQGGVLLLTKSTSLPVVTRSELLRLDPARVVIVGGTGAVSESVRSAVRSALPRTPVDRLPGSTRYETGELIVKDAFASASTAIIATGRNYPDALAAGPAAGYMGAPVVLVDGRGNVPESTIEMLLNLGVTQIVVLGGPSVISDASRQDLIDIVGEASFYPIAGANRYDTAAQLNGAVFAPSDYALISSGANFPDALAGAPLAGALGAPLYLTRPNCLVAEADAGIMASRANGVILLGGTGALSTKVQQLGTC
jgi:putative cell wall-binding protein